MPPPYVLHKMIPVRGQFSLNYKHVFSLEYLYKRLHGWLGDEGYDNSNFLEQLYLERASQNGAKQIWIWWRTTKMYSNFIKFHVNIDYHVLGLTKAEVIHEGTKVGTNKGEVEVFITAWMELDPSRGWDDNFVLKNDLMRNFFLNRVYKAKIEEGEQQLIQDTGRLLGAVKQYMQLEAFLPEYNEKPFAPAKGQ